MVMGIINKRKIYRKENPLINESCETQKEKVKDFFKNYKGSGYSFHKFEKCKQIKSKYNSLLKQSKKQYYSNLHHHECLSLYILFITV